MKGVVGYLDDLLFLEDDEEGAGGLMRLLGAKLKAKEKGGWRLSSVVRVR